MAARALLIDADGNTMKQVSQISFDEDNALQGLTIAAQLIYLRCIRRYVNYSTGICGGHDIRLSWQRFSVICEVIRPARSNKRAAQDKPSRQFIRQRITELETAGLIRSLPSPLKRTEYVFSLPFFPCSPIYSAYEQPQKPTYAQPQAVDAPLGAIIDAQQPQNSALNNAQPLHLVGQQGNISQQSVQNTAEGRPQVVDPQISATNYAQQPQNKVYVQPDIYLRKKEEGKFLDLNDEEHNRCAHFLKALASDGRLHSLDKDHHLKIFKDLVSKEKLQAQELLEMLKRISDNQFTIFLIVNQLKYVRKAGPIHQSKAPVKATPEPKQQQNIRANEIHDELSNLDQMLKYNPDDQKLKTHKLKLTSELEQLNQAS